MIIGMVLILLVELPLNGFSVTQAVSGALPVFALVAQLSLILLIIAILFKQTWITSEIARDGQGLAFLIALSAMLGSLFFQFVMGLFPCELCWFQRIFMYPLPFIIGVSILKKEDPFFYGIPLCLIGSLLAIYQSGTQFLSIASTCSAGTDCSQILIAPFGYITIPVMSLTAFVAVAVLLYLGRSNKKS